MIFNRWMIGKNESVLDLHIMMGYLDILITSRMLIFGEYTPKHKDYWNIQDMATRNLRIWEMKNKWKLEPSKTATPHSCCDTPAPLSWTCSRPSQALVQRSHTPAVEFALPSQPCRTKPHHKRFPVWHQEVRGRARRKEGSKRAGSGAGEQAQAFTDKPPARAPEGELARRLPSRRGCPKRRVLKGRSLPMCKMWTSRPSGLVE